MRQRKVGDPEVPETRCACGGRLHYEVVHRYRFTDEYGRLTEVHNVPAAVCARCGDAVLEPAIVAEIGARIRREYFPPRHLDLADLAAD